MAEETHAYATPVFVSAASGCSAVITALASLGLVVYLKHRSLVARLQSNSIGDRRSADSITAKLPRSERVHLMFEDVQCWAPGGKHILRGLTGQIKPGEMGAVMGPSGCGKTTLLDVLAGRRSDAYATSGRIYVNGLQTLTGAGKALLRARLNAGG